MDQNQTRVFGRIVVTLVWTLGFAWLGFPQPPVGAQDNPWEQLSEGLDWGRFKVAEPSVAGDSTIVVLRIDPAAWELRVLSTSETGERHSMTARQWCLKYNLVAAINAGMFQMDHSTHVGFMKSRHHVNSPTRNKYQSAAAFDPLRPGLVPFVLYDLDHEPLDSVISRYGSVIQNIRMINRVGANRWSRQPKAWSEAALGEDDRGRVLFIFCRSPYPVHDLNRILLSLPIGLICAQHLEGGPEASLSVHMDGREIEMFGSYETGFMEHDNNHVAWPIPNVIGIVKKP